MTSKKPIYFLSDKGRFMPEFKALICSFLLFCSSSAMTHDSVDQACYGDSDDCPVLRDVPTEVYTVGVNLDRRCGSGLLACSKQYKDRCEIYIPKFNSITRTPLSNSAKRKLIRHETNHCRGWDHLGKEHNKWSPIEYPEGW